ncbi:MAG TPA: hypothetical protein VE842_08675 [Pyrinomonadaceae bacterium]|jgi:uncharacterized protein (TIGR02996 family)|nr:hypothetical protein [Pyrinomonadaceae bacterium]
MSRIFQDVTSPRLPEERDLLQAVLENPDDDPPRRKYAQWRMIRGDFLRANFIEIQLGLASPDTDQDSWQAYVFRRRERELVAEHGRAWAGQIAEWVDDYQFDRGFVELITMPASAFLERAHELFKLAPIRHLNLTQAGDWIKELLERGYLNNIHSLSMDRSNLTDHHLRELVSDSNLPRLRWLSIGENKIGLDGVKALVDADLKLDYVRLFGNPCDPIERYAHDGDRIVERWLPEEGRYLEQEYYGDYLPWLHLQNARTIWDVVPNRFRQSIRSNADVQVNEKGRSTEA